jgi:hypothetical protein
MLGREKQQVNNCVLELIGAAELDPIQERRAEVDHRRVQTDELVLEAELPPALRQGLTTEEQCLEDRSVKLPRAMLVGVGQGRATRRGDTQVLELAFAAAEPPQISRSEWARPSWQNSMATNCPQHVNPRAWRSACVRLDQRLEFRPCEQLE